MMIKNLKLKKMSMSRISLKAKTAQKKKAKKCLQQARKAKVSKSKEIAAKVSQTMMSLTKKNVHSSLSSPSKYQPSFLITWSTSKGVRSYLRKTKRR